MPSHCNLWRPLAAVLAIAVLLCPSSLLADDQPKISPMVMSANTPGLEVSAKTLERLAAQSELSYKQLDEIGLRPGVNLDEDAIRKLLQLEVEDSQSRRFIGFFDATLGNPSMNLPVISNPVTLQSPQKEVPTERTSVSDAAVWQRLIGFDPFIADAVVLASFTLDRERQLRDSIVLAAQPIDGPEQIKARATAYALLSEARQAAVRRARGYRQLTVALKRELDGREFVNIIAFAVEIRTSARQPTVSPLSFVAMQCQEHAEVPVLVFDQRRRDCSDSGVCRVESIAAVSRGPEYAKVFAHLKSGGRKYLDGCVLGTTMLVDGTEVSRQLPGKFTSHTGLGLP